MDRFEAVVATAVAISVAFFLMAPWSVLTACYPMQPLLGGAIVYAIFSVLHAKYGERVEGVFTKLFFVFLVAMWILTLAPPVC
ncbi:MAG: hypothetical protein ACK4SY_08760 [Pyrobaculum sp.]